MEAIGKQDSKTCKQDLKEEQEALKVEADQQSCEPSPAPAVDAVPVADEELNTLELTKALFESQSKPADVDVRPPGGTAPQSDRALLSGYERSQSTPRD